MVSNEHDLAYHKEAYEHILKEYANRTPMRMSMRKRSDRETELKAETQTTIRAHNNCSKTSKQGTKRKFRFW